MNSLYIYELSIQSSYAENIEAEATEDFFDTVQWWLSDDETWRIRTFDTDSDIHVHQIKKAMNLEDIESHMGRQYGDVLVGRYDFPNIDLMSNERVVSKMKSGLLEVSKDQRFAFWNHDDREYVSKSRPE